MSHFRVTLPLQSYSHISELFPTSPEVTLSYFYPVQYNHEDIELGKGCSLVKNRINNVLYKSINMLIFRVKHNFAT